jgi:hypothetical protein
MSIHDDDRPDLPGVAQEIADVIGREDALFLIGQLPPCGRRSWRRAVYVPKVPPPDHFLVRVLGAEQAQRLADEFGGEVLQPPNLGCVERRWRNRHIWTLRQRGLVAREISETILVPLATVKKILAAPPPDDDA